jgi:hypothetical protein
MKMFRGKRGNKYKDNATIGVRASSKGVRIQVTEGAFQPAHITLDIWTAYQVARAIQDTALEFTLTSTLKEHAGAFDRLKDM